MPCGECRPFLGHQDHPVHRLRAPQRLDRLDRRLRDRRGDVEGGVHRHLDADPAAERLEVGVGEGIGVLAHDLQAARAVGVDDRGNALARLRFGARGEHHVIIGIVIVVRGAVG